MTKLFQFDTSIIAANDPIKNHKGQVAHWAKYTKFKYEIAKDVKPDVIVEIGVRAGYSAWALLQANPKATYYGFDCDANVPCSRGGPWSPIAEKMLKSRGYKIKIQHDFDSQKNNNLPIKPEAKEVVLYHIDGEHTIKGVYNDLELCFKNAHSGCFILVDDYNAGPSLVVKQGTDKWIKKHKSLIKTKHFPNSGNGDMLIKIV
jgi:hypothetical protein